MKRCFILFVLLFYMTGCENNQKLIIPYEGQKLHIAIIGEIPEIQNKYITFEAISLDDLNKEVKYLSNEFDAIMITPNMFVDASQDKYSEAYYNVELPIVFWNSSKAHYPFVKNKINYLNENEVSLNHSNVPHSMDNQSHSTLFLYDIETSREDAWFFNLDNNNDLKKIYTEVFNKIEELAE